MDNATKSIRYALTLIEEAQERDDHPGIVRANQEQAMLALLEASRGLAFEAGMDKSLSAIRKAWDVVNKETVS